MVYSATPVMLDGALPNDGPRRPCQRCSLEQLPGGGIQISPKKWICSSCWKTHQMANRNRASRGTTRSTYVSST